MKKIITINLLGDIAAGKGTQAKILAKKYSLKHIDTGAYSRRLVSRGIKGAKGLAEKGKLTRSDLIKDYLKNQLGKLSKKKGVVLDGAKMPSEAMLVRRILKGQGREPFVLYLSLTRKESLKRLRLRKRADDEADAIKNRISYYDKIYSKTIKYWQKQKNFRKVDGRGSISSVTKKLVKEIDRYYGSN